MLAVSKLPADTTVVSGGADGVGAIAENVARARGLQIQGFLPDWKRLGKSAGMIRNSEIIANADVVLAFWDGQSRGTKDSIDKAMAALAAGDVWRVTVIREGEDK